MNTRRLTPAEVDLIALALRTLARDIVSDDVDAAVDVDALAAAFECEPLVDLHGVADDVC